MRSIVRAGRTRIHSLLIVRNGYAELDATVLPFQKNSLHDVASVTKSITSTLVGIARGQGRLRGVTQPVLSIFGDRQVQRRDERKEQLTLEHLMTMSSGLDCEYRGGERTLRTTRLTAHVTQRSGQADLTIRATASGDIDSTYGRPNRRSRSLRSAVAALTALREG
jgi:CubicO group peptidase (beta-lactamase class C family)